MPALLDQLETTAGRCADRIERVPSDAWGEPVRIADSTATPTLLAVAQDAVAVVAGHLRAAQQVLDAVA